MKKIVSYFIFTILCLCTFTFSVNAAEVTDKLYMNIFIQKDGSLRIQEVAVLRGSYSGRLRNIAYKGGLSKPFTGALSDFGGSSIYNGSGISDLEIYDIYMSDVNGFDTFNHKNQKYEEVSSASKGDEGVYTKKTNTTGYDLKIFNPASNNRAFYMEYTVKDAVVVHNDTAELYWNLLGSDYTEDVALFQARIYLPSEDGDYRVWGHGPLYGEISRVNNTYSEVTFQNLEAYQAVSVRLMFASSIVPNATKKSGYPGRENILTYEQKQADIANEEREQLYKQILVSTTNLLNKAESNLSLSAYDEAMTLLLKLKDSPEKTALYERAQTIRAKIEVKLIEDVETQISIVKKEKTRDSLELLHSKIELLLEGETKTKFKEEYASLSNMVEARYQQFFWVLTGISVLWAGGLAFLTYQTKKQYEKDVPSVFQLPYFREFPADYDPGVIEYVMNKNVSQNAFSAGILDLVRKKKIRLEVEEQEKKKEYVFFKEPTNEKDTPLTEAEIMIMELIFSVVGCEQERVTLSEIKHFSSTEKNAKEFLKKYNEFLVAIRKAGKQENFFASLPSLGVLTIVGASIGVFLLAFLAIVLEQFIFIPIVAIVGIGMIIYTASKHYRTKKGREHYDKWSAHKRFLLDFGRFKDKEVPEIVLWERYLVTATVLGCATQVQKSMKIHLENMGDESMLPNTVDLYRLHMMQHILQSGMTTAVASVVREAISYSNSTIASANSSSSSGGGFGGGFSGGGGFGGGGGGGGRF